MLSWPERIPVHWEKGPGRDVIKPGGAKRVKALSPFASARRTPRGVRPCSDAHWDLPEERTAELRSLALASDTRASRRCGERKEVAHSKRIDPLCETH